MKLSDAERALLWLSACSGLEVKESDALIKKAGSPEQLYRNFENFSSEVIKLRRNGVYKEGSLSERENQTDRYLKELEKRDFFVITRSSEDFPVSLANIPLPPIVLYGAGNRSLLKERLFCIVGSRRTPPWAEKLGYQYAELLSEQVVIVTGLAEGGDSAALRGALKHRRAICVLPCGLDLCYPAAHASLKEETVKKGLVLTEFPLGTDAGKRSFQPRNRILAGLSEGVLVLSAGHKSGTLITASYAVDYGKDVYAFPYSLGVAQGEGCNNLIKNGAYLCSSVDDICAGFGMDSTPKSKPSLSEEECLVMAVLLQGEECHVGFIAEQAGLQTFAVNALLAALELKGYVVKVGGNRYRAI